MWLDPFHTAMASILIQMQGNEMLCINRSYLSIWKKKILKQNFKPMIKSYAIDYDTLIRKFLMKNFLLTTLAWVRVRGGSCCCFCQVTSVMSDSVWPHRRKPTRLLCPWDSPGKNTRVGFSPFSNACMQACSVASVVSDFVRPHGQQLTRLLCPWDFLGKSTGVGCHFLLQRGWKASCHFLSWVVWGWGSWEGGGPGQVDHALRGHSGVEVLFELGNVCSPMWGSKQKMHSLIQEGRKYWDVLLRRRKFIFWRTS